MTSTQTKPSTYAWLVVALLVPVALLNYLDRQMLAAMKFSLMTDIPDIRSEANWGAILALFKWTYACLSPVGGYLSDRFSRRHVIAVSLVVWSAITWATGQVTTYDQLLLTRAVMGISEAFYIPAALALIADYHRGHTRSRAVGLHQMGMYVGVIIGGFSGYAADQPGLGWRWMFDICGLVGLVYAVPLFLMLRNAPPAESASQPGGPSPVQALRELLANRSFRLMVLYFTLPAMAGWIVRDWMPRFSKPSSVLGKAKPAYRPRSTGWWPPFLPHWPVAGWPIAGCATPTAAASTPVPSACWSLSSPSWASATRLAPVC